MILLCIVDVTKNTIAIFFFLFAVTQVLVPWLYLKV